MTSTHGEVAGGGVPATGGHERSGDTLIAVGAAHPPVEGGSLQGHGGTALRLFVGLSESQAVEFEQTEQVRPPVGRQRCRYWALKKRADHAALSAAEAWGIEMGTVVLRPVSPHLCGRSGTAGEWKAVLRRQRTVEAVRHSAGDCAARQGGARVLRDTSSFHLSVNIGQPSAA